MTTTITKSSRKSKAEYDRKYREANKELIQKRNRQRYEANKESILERNRQRYEANRESILEKQRQYNEANKETKHKRERQRYVDSRTKVDAIKLAVGCKECGYNAHPSALEFNHIDPSTKLYTISQAMKRPWSDIEAEIAKCEVLCANCHRIHTVTNKHHAVRR